MYPLSSQSEQNECSAAIMVLYSLCMTRLHLNTVEQFFIFIRLAHFKQSFYLQIIKPTICTNVLF